MIFKKLKNLFNLICSTIFLIEQFLTSVESFLDTCNKIIVKLELVVKLDLYKLGIFIVLLI